MELLKEKIKQYGEVYPGGIIKVDNFLNHQIDVDLIDKVGKEFFRLFGDLGINKIVTIEASGIGIACLAARYFGTNVVFAKKSESKNMSDNVYSSVVHSFTKGKDFNVRIDKKYLSSDDKVLIIDDFLANGEALLGLISIVEQAGAKVCGCGICIEKAFQPGGDIIRNKGYNLKSLAIVDVADNGELVFMEK